jgi:hypothetical protein
MYNPQLQQMGQNIVDTIRATGERMVQGGKIEVDNLEIQKLATMGMGYTFLVRPARSQQPNWTVLVGGTFENASKMLGVFINDPAFQEIGQGVYLHDPLNQLNSRNGLAYTNNVPSGNRMGGMYNQSTRFGDTEWPGPFAPNPMHPFGPGMPWPSLRQPFDQSQTRYSDRTSPLFNDSMLQRNTMPGGEFPGATFGTFRERVGVPSEDEVIEQLLGETVFAELHSFMNNLANEMATKECWALDTESNCFKITVAGNILPPGSSVTLSEIERKLVGMYVKRQLQDHANKEINIDGTGIEVTIALG